MDEENIILASSSDDRLVVKASSDSVFSQDELDAIQSAVYSYDGESDVVEYLNSAMLDFDVSFEKKEDDYIIAKKKSSEISVKNVEKQYGKILEQREISSAPSKTTVLEQKAKPETQQPIVRETGPIVQQFPPEITVNVNVQANERSAEAPVVEPQVSSVQPIETRIFSVPGERESTSTTSTESSELTNQIASKTENFIQSVISNIVERNTEKESGSSLQEFISNSKTSFGAENQVFSKTLETTKEVAQQLPGGSLNVLPVVSVLKERIIDGVQNTFSSLFNAITTEKKAETAVETTSQMRDVSSSLERMLEKSSSEVREATENVVTTPVEQYPGTSERIQTSKDTLSSSLNQLIEKTKVIESTIPILNEVEKISTSVLQNDMISNSTSIPFVESQSPEIRTSERTSTNLIKDRIIESIRSMDLNDSSSYVEGGSTTREVATGEASQSTPSIVITPRTETFFNAVERMITRESEATEKITSKELAENISQAIQTSVTNIQPMSITNNVSTEESAAPPFNAKESVTFVNPEFSKTEPSKEENTNVFSPMNISNPTIVPSNVVELSLSSIKKLGAEIAKNITLSGFLNEGR